MKTHPGAGYGLIGLPLMGMGSSALGGGKEDSGMLTALVTISSLALCQKSGQYIINVGPRLALILLTLKHCLRLNIFCKVTTPMLWLIELTSVPRGMK